MSINQQSGQISKSALRKLKKRLPKGFISQAMEDLGNRYHKTSIYRVLNGQTTNGEILEVLMDIADISEERKERLEARAKGESEKTEL